MARLSKSVYCQAGQSATLAQQDGNTAVDWNRVGSR